MSSAEDSPAAGGDAPVHVGELTTRVHDAQSTRLGTDRTSSAPEGAQPGPLPVSPASSEALIAGTMVGEYEITGMLGKGGMGTVYSGVQPLIGKKVAIKVLRPELSENQEVMDRFLAEARAVNTIGHPSIIDIFAFGAFDDGTQYYVMELLPGRSLRDLLDGEPLSSEEIAGILPGILDALEAAHDHGIVHRDLKPDNIYLANHPGGGYIVKLLDFGIAKFIEDGVGTGHTATGVPLGTPVYMSPEQCEGEGIDHRADIYALGIILYELFTGQVPFRASSFFALIQKHMNVRPTPANELVQLSQEVNDTILWCLAKDKADRPGSISELREALRPVLGGSPQKVATNPLGETTLNIEKRRRTALARQSPEATRPARWPWVMAVLLLAAVVAGVFVYLRRDQGPAATRPPARAGKVTLQFSVAPASVPYKLWVDDRLVSGRPPVISVPRSSTRRLRIRASAEGFNTTHFNHVPLTDSTVTVVLDRLQQRAAPVPDPRLAPRLAPMREPPMRASRRRRRRAVMKRPMERRFNDKVMAEDI